MKPSLAPTLPEDMQKMPYAAEQPPARGSAEHRIEAPQLGASAEEPVGAEPGLHAAAQPLAEQLPRIEGALAKRVREEPGSCIAARADKPQVSRMNSSQLARVDEAPRQRDLVQATADNGAHREERVGTTVSRPPQSVRAALDKQTSSQVERSARRVPWRKLSGFAVGFASLALWLVLWELASRYEWELLFRFENIPAPSEVFVAVGELLGTPKFGAHVVNSIRRVFIGFSIASLLAVGAGLLIGRFRLASQALLPPLEVLRPIPAVAWIPIAILLFASAEHSMVFITFIGAFFPALLNTIHGVETLDRRLVSASISLGAGPFAVFREVILPGASPSIVTGLSIGMGTSWFSLVTAEMISGQFGIGYYTWEAYTLQEYPHIVLGMISIGILGMGSSFLVKWSGRRFMPWFEPNTSTR